MRCFILIIFKSKFNLSKYQIADQGNNSVCGIQNKSKQSQFNKF